MGSRGPVGKSTSFLASIIDSSSRTPSCYWGGRVIPPLSPGSVIEPDLGIAQEPQNEIGMRSPYAGLAVRNDYLVL